MSAACSPATTPCQGPVVAAARLRQANTVAAAAIRPGTREALERRRGDTSGDDAATSPISSITSPSACSTPSPSRQLSRPLRRPRTLRAIRSRGSLMQDGSRTLVGVHGADQTEEHEQEHALVAAEPALARREHAAHAGKGCLLYTSDAADE